jgi:hypothetical protein
LRLFCILLFSLSFISFGRSFLDWKQERWKGKAYQRIYFLYFILPFESVCIFSGLCLLRKSHFMMLVSLIGNTGG